jgi:hypothetical protein
MICDGEQHQAKLDSARVAKGKVTSRCRSRAEFLAHSGPARVRKTGQLATKNLTERTRAEPVGGAAPKLSFIPPGNCATACCTIAGERFYEAMKGELVVK